MGQTYPLPIPSTAPANATVTRPRYHGVGATDDWQGVGFGDDVTQSKANTPDVDLNGNAVADYGPRTQPDKAAQLGVAMTQDVGRPRGPIDPRQPYPVSGDPAPAAPVVSSVSPTTAPAAQLPLTVTITGTGFTPWSTVYTGGQNTPETGAQYINATTMKVALWAAVPGTVSVAVKDHDVLSNTNVLFTVT